MRFLISVLLTFLVTAALLFLLARSNTAVRSTLNLGPLETQTGRADSLHLWPMNNSRTWTFEWPEGAKQGSSVSLRIREKVEVRKEGDSLAIEPNPPISRADATRELKTSKLADMTGSKTPASATVSIQLVDLSEIGAASEVPGQSLRVLGRLTIGGSTTKLSNKEIILPAGRFAGSWTETNKPKWVNDEMHLMAFYVESDTHRYRYDVIAEFTRAVTKD